ncbi:6-carboxy-5,6,7,8-tetrahydropterin synthase [Sulfidibacter corallicola]|uniref:6-carboxy-5,6,7,8-tetrahydropterin synthase n=1 Tax=Sulfidibacter corallicola TaxID=2818388 RepID=A0A8A4TU28_SULCO|nr:6-carboxytetrahydropterin synthase [Sulfidibacter corallicola]QTD53030.1 6-carboxytetrahydropterin synthase [Sulfidibacter corallicola]
MKVHGREYEIVVSVQKTFRGSHSLPARPELHGHLWEVEFSVSGPLDPSTGMVCDMLVLSDFFGPYTRELDNGNLHELPMFQQADELVSLTAKYPTCDTLAHYFLWRITPDFEKDPRFSRLRLCEITVCIWEENKSRRWGRASIRPRGT